MDIEQLVTEADRREAVPILQQLWTDATTEEILDWTGADGYFLFGGFDDSELVGVAGVLDQEFLHHARHAWLYDLVVDEPRRGRGYGTELLEFVEEWATGRGCEYVALASPLAKKGIHQYYEDRRYEKWGYVIEKEL